MNAQTKKKALVELEQLKARAKALEDIINAPDEPESYQGIHLAKQQDDVTHYYLTISNGISDHTSVGAGDVKYGTAFVNEATAQKAQRLLELKQLYRKAAAKDWGTIKPIWGNTSQCKYVLEIYRGTVCIEDYTLTYHPYHFRTSAAAHSFKNSLSDADARLLVMGLDA